MTTLDICLIAGRRPGLLRRTLESFQARLFQNFNVINCHANIDPIFGDSDDADATEEVIRSFFPQAVIHQPDAANFCTAVKTVWRSSTSPFLFHLEDDWELDEPLHPEEILPVFDDPLVAQVSLNNRHKHWDFRKGPYYTNTLKRKFLWFTRNMSEPFNCFTTSPSFIRGEFARKAVNLMDDRYDPEKQFYNGMNPELKTFAAPYRNYIYGQDKPFIITDIGREWRDERKITKKVVNGASVWQKV